MKYGSLNYRKRRAAIIDSLAHVLRAYDREMYELRDRAPILGPRGELRDQYRVISDLYSWIARDDELANDYRSPNRPYEEKMEIVREISRLLRGAFVREYESKPRQKRPFPKQKLHRWSSVVRYAWWHDVSMLEMERYILQKGGVEKITNLWKSEKRNLKMKS